MKYLLTSILIILIVIGCVESDQSSDKSLKAARELKDRFFKKDKKSPLTDEDKKKFISLSYFPIDPDLQLKALLEEFKNKDTVDILTNDPDEVREMIRYGRFIFEIDNEPYSLTAYLTKVDRKIKIFFVPFADKTNSVETYSGGRYIDIPYKGDGNYVINFNKAYNPYCAYNDKYTCPLVPKENKLDIRIEAGEKKFKSKH
ncbi:MAG: DUF1684 domain-containing protein [Candidatus Kapaibacterium sp.]